jgi:hypothetical protein
MKTSAGVYQTIVIYFYPILKSLNAKRDSGKRSILCKVVVVILLGLVGAAGYLWYTK